MTKLSVNLNKIALVRNTRHLGIPSVVRLGEIALDAGAAGITVHPRPDARHIRAEDVEELATLLQRYPDREFNIEGNPFHNLMAFVREFRPHQCTLVPDAEGQSTSDHGWDLAADMERLKPILAELQSIKVRASLFVDAGTSAAHLAAARAAGASRVELYTEPYAAAYGTAKSDAVLAAYAATATAADAAGLGVNAGHDLNLSNLAEFVEAVPSLLEVSIGHALVADAMEFGMAATVRQYLDAIARGTAARAAHTKAMPS
jgi:pyridoxine 5-phosphate synthase